MILGQDHTHIHTHTHTHTPDPQDGTLRLVIKLLGLEYSDNHMASGNYDEGRVWYKQQKRCVNYGL